MVRQIPKFILIAYKKIWLLEINIITKELSSLLVPIKYG